ncbi:MAG: hypothetical protein GF408_08835 [Candidatus Omnitrophica bacterium]|nr:hypothetical protein [Candidatus Omnitrophota bacterium]
MLYYFYIAGFWLAKHIPLRVSYVIAELIARIYYMFARANHEAIRSNLKVVLGDDISDQRVKKHTLNIFRNFSKYLVDFFRFYEFDERSIERYVRINGLDILKKAMKDGKGAVLVGLHIGNWELGGAIVAALGFPFTVIALEHTDKKINDFFNRQRSINKMHIIPPGPRIKKCFQVLRDNKVLGVVGDKDYTNSGLLVDFFGRKALLPKGPAVFSLKTGAPLIFCALIRNPDDTFTLNFEGPVGLDPSGDIKKDVPELMSKYIAIFEEYIRAYPDQWYAFEKIWKHE